MFKIIGADGKEYGPVTTEQVHEWIREGRANAQTKVQPEGATAWQPLGSLPEFADALAAKPAPLVPPPLGSGGAVSPETLLARDYEISIGDCIGRAWELLSKNFGTVFGGTAIYLLITMGLGGLGSIPFIGWVFSIASLIVTGPLLGGLYYFLLKNVRGQPSDVGEVFDGFRRAFGSLLVCYLIIVLLAVAAVLPGVIMMVIPIIIMAKAEAVQVVPMIFAVGGFFLAIVPAVYLQINWAFALPLVMDKGLDFWPAMRVSWRMIGKHWWMFFALMLVCALINVVGMCACCVGLFLSTPLTLTAMMVAYDRMFPATNAQAA